jgi:hypothetical protein
MTIQEMHYDFKIKVDRVDSNNHRDFNQGQIDWFLNEAQNLMIRNRFTGNNPRRVSFEQDQKRIDDLKSIHVKYPVQPIVTMTDHGDMYELFLSDLLYEYWFLTRAEVGVLNNECTNYISLRPIQTDDLNETLKDPFNKPSTDSVPFNFGKSSEGEGSSIFVYPGDLNLYGCKIEYIKKPVRMSIGNYTYLDGQPSVTTNCELSEHLHPEIVDTAVALAMGTTGDPLVQLSTQKLGIHE